MKCDGFRAIAQLQVSFSLSPRDKKVLTAFPQGDIVTKVSRDPFVVKYVLPKKRADKPETPLWNSPVFEKESEGYFKKPGLPGHGAGNKQVPAVVIRRSRHHPIFKIPLQSPANRSQIPLSHRPASSGDRKFFGRLDYSGAVHIQGNCGTATIVPGPSFDTGYYGVPAGIPNIASKKVLPIRQELRHPDK
ncbi:MAG: hypothetical protein METHP_02019 [Methanoregula sp. SKADARSKE-2]|nr:MAG: hypothetical protein METHP_02019 [Methanoregula sp. SKADARSKE-2]